MTKPKVLFIFLLVAAYVVTPVLDAFACDGCKDDRSLQVRCEVRSTEETHTGASSHDADSETNTPADAGAMIDLCPLCANAASELKGYECIAPIFSHHVVSSPVLLALLDPSYPINKPPQN